MTSGDASATIDVDIGGTFTDCFVRLGDGRMAAAKTPTTGYRLAVGFMRSLKTAATDLGLDVGELLSQTETIRYSTTVAMNTLLQRTGPRLGLVATEGFHDVLRIGRGASWMDAAVLREIRNVARITKAEPLVAPDMVLPVRERIDCFGKVVRPLDEAHFLDGLRTLVDRGARGFVVSLMFAYVNPVHEQRIRELIESEFPEAYLGAMPIMLSSEVMPKRWEYTRTNTTLLNAYLHQSMWEELSGMGDELRDAGYKRSIMMVHNTGGTAEVYRTSAVQTYNGGPVAGLIGGSALGRRLGFDNVLVTDMGGTSFDIGLVVKGSTRFYQFRPIIDRYWVDMSILETRSIGAGGGSIARVNETLGGKLEVGPKGAGSMPGPACYGLGGAEPTVTDADVVLGYINPERYFGGKMRLRPELARKSIETNVAKPLGISAEEAALRIKRTVDANMADVIARETYLRGFDPKAFILFAFGGAGPTHCVGYGGALGMKKMVIFPYSAVFCAWGASTMPLAHIYEASRRIELLMPHTKQPTTAYAEFNETVERLEERARKDLAGEGYDPARARFGLELDIKYGGQIHIHRASSPKMRLRSERDVLDVYAEFEREYADAFSPVNVFPEGGVEIHSFVLRAELEPPQWQLANNGSRGADPCSASRGRRRAIWDDPRKAVDTPVFDRAALASGNRISGPAVVEAAYTTIVVEPGYELEVDPADNLILSKS